MHTCAQLQHDSAFWALEHAAHAGGAVQVDAVMVQEPLQQLVQAPLE